MTTHRKQFGKRCLPQDRGGSWPQTQTSYSSKGSARTLAVAGSGPSPSEADTGFSLGETLWWTFTMFFSFSGRINRLVFWGMSTLVTIIQFVMIKTYTDRYGIDFQNAEAAVDALIYGDHTLSLAIIFLLPAISNFSLTVRRMHDREVSATWIFAWFIPIVGTIICLCQTFANLFFAGTNGRNRFDSAENLASVFD